MGLTFLSIYFSTKMSLLTELFSESRRYDILVEKTCEQFQSLMGDTPLVYLKFFNQ